MDPQIIWNTGSALFGAMLGAFVAWRTWLFSMRREMERELLSDALAIQSLKEAWILDGSNYKTRKLSTSTEVPIEPKNNNLGLRRVEVRAVLDEARWNAPKNRNFGFVEGRRTWIVRDQILERQPSYQNIHPASESLNPHPALLSSKAEEELIGWVERVASAQDGRGPFKMLSPQGLEMLAPLLTAVAGKDRLEVFGDRLTKGGKQFLEKYRKEYMN